MKSSNQPLVSVVIPTKNRCALVQQTLGSLIAQSYPHWEAIVVDDQSTDDTVKVLNALAQREPRLRLIVRPDDVKGGAPVCRNIGFDASRGQLIVFFDSDDLMAQTMLENRVAVMRENPHLDFAAFRGWMFDKQPGDAEMTLNRFFDEDDLERILLHDAPWLTPNTIWRRTFYERIGGWDEQILNSQDVDLNLRALAIGPRYVCINAFDFYVRAPAEQRDNVGINPNSLKYLSSHLHRIDQAVHAIKSHGQLTRRRAEMLAGNYLFYAERWADEDRFDQVWPTWRRVRRYGLVSGWRYLLGWLYLRMRKTFLSHLLIYVMYRTWPKHMFVRTRKAGARLVDEEKNLPAEYGLSFYKHPHHQYREILADGLCRYIARRLIPRRLLAWCRTRSKVVRRKGE